MILKNLSNIPDIIHQAIYQSENDGSRDNTGDFSATELLNPVQVIILNKRYGDKVVVDSLSRLKPCCGTAVHEWLAKTNISNAIQEERIKIQLADFDISGQPDLIHENKIKDYKNTSVTSYIWDLEHIKHDWPIQFSQYRYFYFKKNGITLSDRAVSVVRYEDFRQSEWEAFQIHGRVALATGNPNSKNGWYYASKYPPLPVMEFDVPLWPIADTEKWLLAKLADIAVAMELPDEELPECTDEDRWYNKNKGYIRCNQYCDFKSVCKQFERGNVA